MADKNPIWKMGEYRGMIEREAVEYGETINPGDFLKITGLNADGQPIVRKQTAATTAIYVAPLQSEGVAGDVKEVVCRAEGIKVKFGSNVAPGALLKVKANEAVAVGTAASGNHIGWSRVQAVNDDTGIIAFTGGLPA
ncbi:MAG: hypothetical protein OXC46_03155 [Thaumarchaeota archaeon]|nr:hypothetical protein [Nitrososphaerota archaeon]